MPEWTWEALVDAGAVPSDAVLTDFSVVPFAAALAYRSTLGLITVG